MKVEPSRMDYCSYERDPTELPSPSATRGHHMEVQGEVRDREGGPHPAMRAPQSDFLPPEC